MNTSLERMPELVSWLGNASYGVAGRRFQETIPITFSPTDISGLKLWLEANDATTVNANFFGTVDSWHNKGDLSGNFDLSGTADVRYGQNTVNGLDVVTFNGDAYMTCPLAMNFHDRSLFIVSRRNQAIDPSGNFFSWLTSETTNGMETGIVQSNGDYTYLLSRHPGFAPEIGFTTTTDTQGFAELVTFQNSSTDLSGNYAALNSQSQALVVSALASYNQSNLVYALGNYGNGVSIPNNYDLCELIMYDSVLSEPLRTTVEGYLTTKWFITNPPPPPPPPPPAPFAPIAVFDFNNYVEFDSTLVDTLAGDPATINEQFQNVYDVADPANKYLSIYAPNNNPDQTGGIFLPSIAGVQAIEMWVRYVGEWGGYGQYVLDGRTGFADSFWISVGDTIGAGWDGGLFVNNTIGTPIDATAGTPQVVSAIADQGWRQLWFLSPTPFTDDLALFMRFTGIQGMPIDVAYVGVYTTLPTEADVIAEFNAKCARYDLAPV